MNDAMRDAVGDAVSGDAGHEPHIQVVKGNPTDAEIAALVAVLAGAGGAGEPAQPERTRWGLPVDRLRFAMSNWQRLTMQQLRHMRQ